MTELVVVVASVALVDSLNPATVVPALYLATIERPVRAILGFAAGFLVVNLAGGLVALALGNRLAGAVPSPAAGPTHWGALAAGAACLVAAVFLWVHRQRLGAGFGRAERLAERLAPASGGIIAFVELPTALPYFLAIGLVAGGGEGPAAQVALLVLFQLVFLAPVGAVAVARAASGARGARAARRARALALRWAGAAIAILVAAFGVVLVATGTAGLLA